MSDLYRLALALRGANDSSLAQLIHERSLVISEYKDFFDLAQAILAPKSLALIMASCTAGQIRALRALLAEEKISKEQLKLLAQDLLVWDSGDPQIFDWLREKLLEHPKTLSLKVIQDAPILIDSASVDRDCGIHAFEAMQAVTEIIFDLEHHLVREVGKSALGLPDVKRLSTHLGKPKEYVRAIFDLARSAGFVSPAAGRFRPTKDGVGWLGFTPQKRWQLLAQAWIAMLGEAGCKEVSGELRNSMSVTLPNLLDVCFPFGASGTKLARLNELAEIIGLSSQGAIASWFAQTLKSPAEAAKLISHHLPSEQDRIIIQGDLSIIAPGPLPAKVEVSLRRFAETENIGLASGYRISALSISSGLEDGMSESEIRSLLESLGGAPLPQPVDYLLRETAERFGRIKIQAEGKSSIVLVTDPLLAKQLFIDSKLKGFMLSAHPLGLSCPIEAELLYHSLRDAGYIAVRVDENQRVIRPSTPVMENESAHSFADQLERLRAADLATEPVENDLERKIQLALRSKSTLQVEVSANGQLLSFLLEPIGIANGRLRARDRKADIERTLPVSAITSITIG